MVVYRITKTKYAQNLKASGRANRWNTEGEFVVYASASRALATLELLAHRNAIMPKQGYTLIHIGFDKKWVQNLAEKLPKDWFLMKNMPKTQAMGSAWYRANASLVLRVPSALLKGEYNYMINTKHPDFSKANIIKTENFKWDSRLL